MYSFRPERSVDFLNYFRKQSGTVDTSFIFRAPCTLQIADGPDDHRTPQVIWCPTKEIDSNPTDASRTVLLRKTATWISSPSLESPSTYFDASFMQTMPFEGRNRPFFGKGVDCVPKLAFLVAYLTAQRNHKIKPFLTSPILKLSYVRSAGQTTEMKGLCVRCMYFDNR